MEAKSSDLTGHRNRLITVKEAWSVLSVQWS